ncbi:uncharacterized protein MYCGRDRAFT_109561 [Zymoseptoria tritici IPO323]|uniref:PAS domain-containing protein n=1 Tax=Zymoseptoria tritici (strain CBS 115943 / IPO323) TaxID=336722 RepID=F9XAZ1_ZYMTI|nr:uncharacterized protein MYCGRDRAFT_109561 [Zymoseptoria tritici IPO323]EGP87220.1 hypothetical protein MYCGRDRAFT_109561 [Zymoseptoria tritici IPO323]
MDTTFISIHDLTEEAKVLYSSDSVVDILGYTPDELVNRSAWDFFALDDLPSARRFHARRVASDKAAVLAYCRIKDKSDQWVGCECCFTIVYDVMVVCTSIYKRGMRSDQRAADAPVVRRLFSSSPKDPRYHMMSHLSTKFAQPSKPQEHEPRAALFLNRFTRTLTIMYATSGLAEVIGIPAEVMRGRSFYYCIAENCLQDAIKCLENAKGNDSIAYLRFWFRDPRTDDEPAVDNDSDEEMTTDTSDGGVDLEHDAYQPAAHSMDIDNESPITNSRQSSGDSSTRAQDTHEAVFGQARTADSSASSVGLSPDRDPLSPPQQPEPIELEAVISCTSDGLVVCLRKARPIIPQMVAGQSVRPAYANGLFAAPWALEPVLPSHDTRAGANYNNSFFAPSQGPQAARQAGFSTPADQNDFMNAIREQAVFAWALTGINGSLAAYGQGRPCGESLPVNGLPVWASDPYHASGEESGGSGSLSGQEFFGSATRSPQQSSRSKAHIFGDPGLGRNGSGHSSGTGNR